MEYIPLFPLGIVAFPGEKLNLHVFEPRYRQLVAECLADQKCFGIPSFVNGRLPGQGTEMFITKVEEYEDGRLDIQTLGGRVFKLVDLDNPAPGKLFAGGHVHFHPEEDSADQTVMAELLETLDKLYKLLQVQGTYDLENKQCFSYQIAHTIGLSLEDEYELLTIDSEMDRQLFLLAHLNKVLPMMENMESTRQRIRMNGHFKEFDPLNF